MGELFESPDEQAAEGSRDAYLARAHESAFVWRVECVDCGAATGSLLLWRVVDEAMARRWADQHAKLRGHETRVT